MKSRLKLFTVKATLPGDAFSSFEDLPISVAKASSKNDIQACLDDLFKQAY